MATQAQRTVYAVPKPGEKKQGRPRPEPQEKDPLKDLLLEKQKLLLRVADIDSQVWQILNDYAESLKYAE